MAETALVVLLPELEPLIGGWRQRHTGDGARGMPPHVTLVAPFADSSQVDGVLDRLSKLLASFRAVRNRARGDGAIPWAPLPQPGAARAVHRDH